MKLTKASLPVLTFSLLALSGCGGDDVRVEPMSQDWMVEQIDGAVVSRKVDSANSEKALAKLDLLTPGLFTWDNRKGGSGNYTFEALVLPANGGTIDSLSFSGLRMEGNSGPYFDSIAVRGVALNEFDGTPKITVENARFNVSPEMVEDIARTSEFVGVDSFLEDAGYLDLETLITAGSYAENVVSYRSEGEARLGFVGWIPGTEDFHVSALAEDGNVSTGPSKDPNNPEMVVKFDALSLKNYDAFNRVHMKPGTLARYNFFDQGFESFTAENLKLSYDGLVLETKSARIGLEGDLEGKHAHIMDVPSVAIDYERAPINRYLISNWERFEQLGYDSLDLSVKTKVNLDANNDTVRSEYFDITMDGAFNISGEFTIKGSNHLLTTLEDFQRKLYSDNVPLGELRKSYKDVMSDAYSKLDIENVDFVLDDETALENMLQSMATEQDVSIDVARQQMRGYAMMMTLGVEDKFQASIAEDFALSAQDFLSKGGGMRFSIKPAPDYSLPEAYADYQRFHGPAIFKQDSDDAAEPKTMEEIFGPLNMDFEHIPE